MSAKILNRRQARWSMALSRFDFIITYRLGSQQGKTDALSRRAYLVPKEGEAIYNQQKSIILKPERLALNSLESSFSNDLSIVEEIQKTLKQDPLVENVQRQMKEGKGEDFEFKDGLLFYRDLLYVPPCLARLKILQVRHDLPAAGHFGVNKIIELVSRDYWWPQLWKFVKEYIRSCDTCSRAKGTRHRPYGLFNPYQFQKVLGYPCPLILLLIFQFPKL